MIAITSLLVTITLSLIVTRVAAMALMLTGMSREAARFQARSAFTGVGFTTTESETVSDHPVRRKIIMTLMLLGNVGIATVVATTMVSFIDTRENDQWMFNLTVLFGGVLVLILISKSRWVERRLNIIIAWSLKRFSKLDVRDYIAVLHLQKGYAITELRVSAKDWLANKCLSDLRLSNEGVLVLGVQRLSPNAYIGAPTAATTILVNDTLVLYGPIDRLEELDQRRAGRKGDKAHVEACTEHAEVLVKQDEEASPEEDAVEATAATATETSATESAEATDQSDANEGSKEPS